MSAVFDFCSQNLAIEPVRPVAYIWDDDLYTNYFYFEDIQEYEVFEQISQLGNRALCIAIGEWICAELRQTPQYTDALNFFNAAWVTMIQEDTCEYIQLEKKAWPGPLLGPLRAAMLIVNDTVFDAEEDFDFSSRSCWAINLARYIAEPERSGIFESWLQEVLARLIRHHSSDGELKAQSIFDSQFSFGDPVAPSLFVTNDTYNPSTAKFEIINLAQTMRGSNPYLNVNEDLDPEWNSEEIVKTLHEVNLVINPSSKLRKSKEEFSENALCNLNIPDDLADQVIDKDWKGTENHVGPERYTPLEEAIEFKTSAALLTLMAGSMFWAYERLRKHTDASIMLALSEAIFCYQVDPLYFNPIEKYRFFPITDDFQLPKGAVKAYPWIFFEKFFSFPQFWPIYPPRH